ncbi:maleylpyruvate isomerase family mycothiol-dependent enzyme [Streptosporangium sp. NPDC023963]|uniref:maleylpyruvate isomerase family mycothiol-dependent enzyme n=1 Tax=Streptosporangium sp. NPDC023963 TaxID=3155608 RepID=UPI00342F3EFB
MDDEEIFSWTADERLGLAALLGELEDHEWAVASLCPGWTVHDVAAHMTLSTHTLFLDTLRGVIRTRGDINRVFADQARDRAARFGPAELVAQLRETAGSRRRGLGSRPLDTLVDVLVHGQDIARPLGRVREMPAERAVAGLGRVLGTGFYGAPRRLRGTRLVATDLDWAAGEGPDEVRGPAGDLLLLATGRAAGLAGLSGPGVERVAAAL